MLARRRLLTLGSLVAVVFGAAFVAPTMATAADTCNGLVVTVPGGTAGDDSLQGTNGPDVIAGLGGDDTIQGLGGDDTICGGDGNDIILAGDGNDLLLGEGGDVDLLEGGPGNDAVNGGDGGADLATFLSGGAVTANLASGLVVGQGNDTLNGIEGLYGSGSADTLIGDDSGFNTFLGGAGNDSIDGRGGVNAIMYSQATLPMIVNLLKGTAKGEGTDKLTSIQIVVGSPFNDKITGGLLTDFLIGDAGDDLMHGGAGDDSVQGGDGNDTVAGDAGDDELVGGPGNDSLIGGAGVGDFADYASAAAPITASLTAKSSTGEGTDSIASMEGIAGSSFGDSLFGNGQENRIAGLAGDDSLHGAGGNDLVVGGEGTDSISGDAGSDYCDGETNTTCESGPGGSPQTAASRTDRSLPGPIDLNDVARQIEAAPGAGEPVKRQGQGFRVNDPGTLVGAVRARLVGSTQASDTTSFEFGGLADINPIQCFPNTRQVYVPILNRAAGDAYTTYGFYWDAVARAWIYDDTSGWIYPAGGFLAYTLFEDGTRIYDTGFINNYWHNGDGTLASDVDYTVGNETDYYFIAEKRWFSDGSYFYQIAGGHLNPGVGPLNYCILPR